MRFLNFSLFLNLTLYNIKVMECSTDSKNISENNNQKNILNVKYFKWFQKNDLKHFKLKTFLTY